MKLNRGLVIGFISAVVVAFLFVVAAFIVDLRIGAIVGIIALAVIVSTFRTYIKPSVDYARLVNSGIRGTGTIRALSETGTWINNAPQCKVDLEVLVHGRAVYTTTTLAVIPYLQAPEFQVGTQHPLAVDPKNYLNVLLLINDEEAN